MFLFKKNIPALNNLIPSTYIDIHSHILPNIDDGSKNIAETTDLINKLTGLGFSKIITTPHIIEDVWKNNSQNIAQNLQETVAHLKENNQNIPIKAAAEYMLDGGFYDLIKKQDKLLCLKENYILVEMSYLAPPRQLYDVLFELQILGYIPLLAHPERYTAYHFSTDEYKKLKNAGCLFQLNLLSTVGYYGAAVTKTADFLLKNNMIDFVGSDVHHDRHISAFNSKILVKNHQNLNSLMQNNSFFDF